MKTALLTLYVFCLQFQCLVCENFRYRVDLDKRYKFELFWDVYFEKSTIHFKLEFQSHRKTIMYFGFSNYGKISNADLVMYRTDSRGKHHFQDCWSDSTGILHIDQQQDYILADVVNTEKTTTLEFQRKFDTCDSHDYIIDHGTTHILFALETGFLDVTDGIRLNQHDFGLQRVQLLKADLPHPYFPDDVWTFEIRAPSIEVPDTETTYWWYTTLLPELKEKHHIIKYEGIIQDGNHNLVHHMEVFHCQVGAHDVIPRFSGPGLAEGKPKELESCRKVIGAWAMGAQAMILPDEAGTPVGGEDYALYVLLEIHFNNPQRLKGVRDTSGIRFYVTKNLRPYDSGIMEIGLEYTNKMAIPPRQELFSLTGYCIPECTKVGLPAQGIKVYASQLHTHMTGKRVFTKHVRNGVELSDLNRDNHYSPHFQEIRALPHPVHVLPGDSLITTCEDSTSNRPNVTVGGFSIHEEMCVNYIHYYPLVDLEVCKSSVSDEALDTFFGIMHRWNSKAISRDKGIKENFQSIYWTPWATEALSMLYEQSPISMQCNRSDGTRFPGIWDSMPIPPVSVHNPANIYDSCIST